MLPQRTCNLQRNLWMALLPTVWILLRSSLMRASGFPSWPVTSSRLTRSSPASIRTRRITKRACMWAWHTETETHVQATVAVYIPRSSCKQRSTLCKLHNFKLKSKTYHSIRNRSEAVCTPTAHPNTRGTTLSTTGNPTSNQTFTHDDCAAIQSMLEGSGIGITCLQLLLSGV